MAPVAAAPLLPHLLPAIGTVVGGLFGSGTSSYGNYKQQQLANKANRELADLEWERNQQMWHMQNAYNTPASQMQRYRDAGLNPNLMYQQGTSGNASSSPTYNRPTMQAARMADFNTNIAPTLQTFADMKVKQAQANNMAAQTNLITEQAQTEAARRANIEGETSLIENRRLNMDTQSNMNTSRDWWNWEQLHMLRDQRPHILAITQSQAKEAAIKARSASLQYLFDSASYRSRLNLVRQSSYQGSLQSQLRELGIHDNDPVIVRWLSRLGNEIMPKGSDGNRRFFWQY